MIDTVVASFVTIAGGIFLLFYWRGGYQSQYLYDFIHDEQQFEKEFSGANLNPVS